MCGWFDCPHVTLPSDTPESGSSRSGSSLIPQALGPTAKGGAERETSVKIRARILAANMNAGAPSGIVSADGGIFNAPGAFVKTSLDTFMCSANRAFWSAYITQSQGDDRLRQR